MWSGKFLWQGLTTGVLAAALALGGMWLLLFVVSRGTHSDWSIVNFVNFCSPGLILYPVCWYGWIYRRRDYSAGRTMTLVIVTFLVAWAVVATLMALSGAYVVIKMVLEAASPFAYAMMTLIGAVTLFLSFVVIAAPMAFLHRWILLLLVAPSLDERKTLAVKNPFRQPGHKPTPTMKVIWFVVLLALAATAVATLVLHAFIVFSTMLPTVPDAIYIHPTRFMGHMVYLSHFLDLAYSNIGLVFLSGFVVGLAALVTWSVLDEREKERRHNIRMEEMKMRGEFD